MSNSQSPEGQSKNTEVLEPEIISPGGEDTLRQQGWQQEQADQGPKANSFGRQEQQVVYQVFRSGGGQGAGQGGAGFSQAAYSRMRSGPVGLSFVVTVFLALSVLMQFGLLAAIGFLVFMAVGSAFSFFFLMQRLMQGRLINPWLPRIANWALCYSLVAWLSQ